MPDPSVIDRLLADALTQPKDLRTLFNQKLAETGLRNKNVSELLGIERNSLNPIIDGTAQHPKVQNLLKVAEFLGLDFEGILAAFMRSNPSEELKDLERARKASFVTTHFDLPRLKKVGFLERVDDLGHIEERICRYFSIPTVYAYATVEAPRLYSKTKVDPVGQMREFWVKSAYGHFERLQDDRPYDRDLLRTAIIPKLRGYTRNVERGLVTVIKALYNVGITVLFQQHLANTQVRGATMVLKGKPCIVITDLNKNYATIWFALVHELYHVLYDLESIASTMAYHLTGDEDLLLIEDKANAFARELLFSDQRVRYIAPLIHNEVAVTQYAEEAGVHPAIVYAFYQHYQSERGEDYWRAFKPHFPDVKRLTKDLNVCLWTEDSIDESARKIKKVLGLA